MSLSFIVRYAIFCGNIFCARKIMQFYDLFLNYSSLGQKKCVFMRKKVFFPQNCISLLFGKEGFCKSQGNLFAETAF